MNFTAIDFETANEKRTSAISIGITKVIDNKIVDEKYFLIKPPEMRFNPQNTWIHGLYPEDVENEKTFLELWPKISKFFEDGDLIVAHNAAFDLSVLRALAEYYNIKLPFLRYCCTVILSTNVMKDVQNHKLNTLAEKIGYKFKHHNALEDSNACAKIMIYICNKLKIENLLQLSLKGGLTIGEIFNNNYDPCSSLIKQPRKPAWTKDRIHYTVNDNCKYFKDKVVVFTGPLESMKRAEASNIIKKLGGIVAPSVSKKTNCLVTNINKSRTVNDMYKSCKLRKAEALIENGQSIEIITEDQFLKYAVIK